MNVWRLSSGIREDEVVRVVGMKGRLFWILLREYVMDVRSGRKGVEIVRRGFDMEGWNVDGVEMKNLYFYGLWCLRKEDIWCRIMFMRIGVIMEVRG